MKMCEVCKNENDSTAKFCQQCGKPLKVNVSDTQQPESKGEGVETSGQISEEAIQKGLDYALQVAFLNRSAGYIKSELVRYNFPAEAAKAIANKAIEIRKKTVRSDAKRALINYLVLFLLFGVAAFVASYIFKVESLKFIALLPFLLEGKKMGRSVSSFISGKVK